MIALIQILSSIVIAILILRWDIKTDEDKKNNEVVINHKKEWWQRLGLMSVPIIISAIPLGEWYYVIISGIMFGSWYWLFFDGCWQKYVAGNNFFSVSKTGKGWLDGFQRKIGSVSSFLIKAILIIVSTFFYIKFFPKINL